MRSAFHQQLEDLTEGVAQMCQLAGTAMQHATHALLEADLTAAESVISDHELIKDRAATAERDAFVLLALQAPVASDLRAVLGALKNVADADRMAVLARHIAEITRRRHPAHALPGDVHGHFTEMGRLAVDIGTATRKVVRSGDPESAAQLARDDDALDALHRHLFTVVMAPDWSHSVASAVDVTLLSRYYERFADHAVEIGRRVIYQATGELPVTELRH
jgi:phosphate transport system protein